MKKILSLILVLAMMLSASMVPTFAQAEERPVITIAREANTMIEDYDTNEFTLMLEEALGVDIQIEIYSEATAKLNLLVAGNSKLPDIINFYLDTATIENYAANGVLLPLTEYFSNPELAPNFLALDDATRNVFIAGTAMSDGNIYSMSLLGEYFPNEVRYHYLINKTWLDQLGLDIPKTTDEFRAALEAFAANDMNGNGIDDEIPMIGTMTGWGQNIAAVLLNSYINANPEFNYFYPKDGVVHAGFMEDAFRDGLEYIRGLVADGLLDPVSFTQSQDQLKALLNQDVAIAGVIQTCHHGLVFNKPADADVDYDIYYDHPIASQYVLMDYPIGPEGVQEIIYNPVTPSQLFFITKDCQNPELAFKLGDLGYSQYASWMSRYGTEGDNWTTDPEVLSQYKGPTINGEEVDPAVVILDEPWARAQNKHWMQVFPGHFASEFTQYIGVSKDSRPNVQAKIIELDTGKIPEEFFVRLVYTADEQEELSFIQSSVNSYVKECITAFVTGNMDLENDWDDYIAELKNMDVDRYVELTQTAYDRTK